MQTCPNAWDCFHCSTLHITTNNGQLKNKNKKEVPVCLENGSSFATVLADYRMKLERPHASWDWGIDSQVTTYAVKGLNFIHRSRRCIIRGSNIGSYRLGKHITELAAAVDPHTAPLQDSTAKAWIKCVDCRLPDELVAMSAEASEIEDHGAVFPRQTLMWPKNIEWNDELPFCSKLWCGQHIYSWHKSWTIYHK